MFQAFSSSQDPFLCLYWSIKQEEKITGLQSTITELRGVIDNLTQIASESVTHEPSPLNQRSFAEAVQSTLPTSQAVSLPTPSFNPDDRKYNIDYGRKFNVVVYGLKEPAAGTPRYQRSVSDLQSVRESLESVDDNISEHAIRDCLRLGRYNVSKHRPVLVKLSRTCDVASVLSKRKNLASQPGIQIRPDLPKSERAIQSTLLIERRKLINSGLVRSSIRIKGSSIYVNGKKHGHVKNSAFVASVTTPLSQLILVEKLHQLVQTHPWMTDQPLRLVH